MRVYIFYIFFIIFALIFFIKIKKNSKKIILSEIFWLLFSWGICLCLYFFGGISYQYKLGNKELAYILVFLFMLILGIIFGRKFVINSEVNNKIVSNDEKVNLKPLFIMSLISIIIYIICILYTNDITFGVTRNINRSMFTTLLVFMADCSLIIWLYELANSLMKNKKLPIYAYLSFIIFLIPSLLISGRDGILIQLLSTFFIFIYCGNYNKERYGKVKNIFRKHKRKLIAIILILFIYFNFLSNSRYGNDMISRFEWATKAKISDELMHIVKLLGNFGYLFLNFVYYYSSQFSKLSFIIDHYSGPYLYGFFQLHILSRRLPESWGLNYINATNSADQIMRLHGYNGLVKMWGTTIQHFIFDFGRIGAIVVVFIIGIFIGKIRRKFDRNKDEFSIIMQAMICTALFISVQISPIFDLSWIFPFLWIIIIEKIWKKKVKKYDESTTIIQ